MDTEITEAKVRRAREIFAATGNGNAARMQAKLGATRKGTARDRLRMEYSHYRCNLPYGGQVSIARAIAAEITTMDELTRLAHACLLRVQADRHRKPSSFYLDRDFLVQ